MEDTMDKTDHANKGQIRNITENIYILIYKQEVLGITNSPFSFMHHIQNDVFNNSSVVACVSTATECVCPATEKCKNKKYVINL
jgi:hypothetical protein